MPELHEDEDGFGDVADRGRADGDVLHGAPALLHQGEAAFVLVAQGPEQRVAGFVSMPRSPRAGFLIGTSTPAPAPLFESFAY